MEKLNLYTMTNDIVELMGVEEVGENEKAEMIEAIKDMIANKAEGIIAITRNFESRIDAIKSEEKRLAEYRKSEEKKLDRLKEYTLECLSNANIKKLDTNLGRISLAKKPASLEIIDESKVPNIYKTTKEVTSIDKAQIKKDLKENKVDGVALVEGGYRLAIK